MQYRKTGKLSAGCAALAVGLLASSAMTAPAGAQSAPPAAGANEGGIETVYVTAEKRVERNIDVPIAITVNDAEQLKNKNIGDMTELAEKMPNVNGGGTFFTSLTIRGISADSAGGGFPVDVGVNVDEVFMGRDRAFDTVLYDVSNVEVLYGPQGTLYGKNTLAGVINITTNRPGDVWEADGDVRYGNYNYLQVRAATGGPIIDDKLSIRVAGFYQERDGFISDPVLDNKLGSLGQKGGRVMIVAKPLDHLTVELRADIFAEDDTIGQNEVQATLSASTCPIPAMFGGCGAIFNSVPPQNPRDRVVDVNTPPMVKRDMWGSSAKAEYDWDGYSAVSITSWRHLTSDFNLDQDGGPLDGFDTGQGVEMKRFSEEFRIASPGDTRFTWIAGAYLDHESDHNLFHIHVGDGFPVSLFGLGLPPLPVGYSEASTANALINSTSWAGFVSATYKITDQLKLSAGIRYTDDQKKLAYSQLPTQLYAGYPLDVVYLFAEPIPPLTDQQKDSAPSGDVDLSYSFTPDEVAYVRFARGYKAGGFQSDIISPPFNPAGGLSFKPEYLNDYEIGLKSQLLDNRLTANLSAYYYDFSNKQEEINTGVSFVVSNAASATSRGLEAQLDWQPIDGFDLFANGGFIDAFYNSFPNGGGLGVPYTGHVLVGASKWSGSWGASYIQPFDLIPGTNYDLTTDWDYRSGQFTDPANTEAQMIQPYLIINARAGIESDDGRWGFYVWGKNLGNRTVLGGGVDVLDSLYVQRGINIGRTFGLELRAKI